MNSIKQNAKTKKNETLNTLKQVDEHIWMLEYKSSYGLDALLESGEKSILGVVRFLQKEVSCPHMMPNIFHDGGCSTFNAKTPDGKYILGRNFDYKDAPCIVLWTNPENGYKSMSIVDTTVLFYGYKRNNLKNIKYPLRLMGTPYTCMDGINEKGLACAVLEIKAKSTKQKTGKKPITTTVALRAILDKCATVDEAINLLSSYDMYDLLFVNYHYQILDSNGNSAIIEYVDNKMHIIRQQKEEQSIITTNFFLTPGGDNTKSMGRNRFRKIEKCLENNNGIITEEKAMELLAHNTLYYHHEWMPHMVTTLWSGVYNSTDMSLLLCAGMDYHNMYKFSLERPGEYTLIKENIETKPLNEGGELIGKAN